MTDFCQDIDVMGIEPKVYLIGGLPGQTLVSGNNGQLAGATFTASGANFSAAKVEAGMVLCLYRENIAEGSAYEIVSVDSATQLTISVLRADRTSPAIPPAEAAGSGLSFLVRTLSPQIHRICAALSEKLRTIVESSPIASARFADSQQLHITAATGTLATIFLAMAEEAGQGDVNWLKAQNYRQQFAEMQNQLRLAIDADGDGTAEQTRTLGNVTLRRI